MMSDPLPCPTCGLPLVVRDTDAGQTIYRCESNHWWLLSSTLGWMVIPEPIAVKPRAIGLWTPISLPLTAWFNPRAITGLADGADVQTFPDSSGLAHHGEIMDVAKGTYNSVGLNGYPAVMFGVNEIRYATDLPTGVVNETVMAAAKITSLRVDPWASIIAPRGMSGGGREFSMRPRNPTNIGLYLDPPDWNAPGVSWVWEESATTTPSPGDSIIGFSTRLGNAAEFYLNGVTEDFTVHDEVNDPDYTTNFFEVQGYPVTVMQIGGWGSGVVFTNDFIGAIGDIVMTNVALGLGDVQKLQGWMHHRYGLEGLLAESHPYKLAPPMIFESAPLSGQF